MKNLLLFVFVLLIGNCYSQGGWIAQTSGAGNNALGIVRFIDSQTGWVGGSYMGATVLLKTTNAGNNWIQQTVPTTKWIIGLCFTNSLTGYIVGGSDVPLSTMAMKTTNGGINWYNMNTSSPFFLIDVFFTDSNNGFITGNGGTILRTTNAGGNWTSQSIGANDWVQAVSFANSQTGWIVGTNGNIYKTTNSGVNWNVQVSGTTNELRGVYFISANSGWAVGENGTIRNTTNGGINWLTIPYGTTDRFTDVFFTSQQTGWIVGGMNQTSCKLIKTTNGGINWYNQVSNVNSQLESCFFSNSLEGYAVGANGVILKTITGGELAPSAPTLLSPSNNSTNVNLTPTLFWNTVSGATSYKVIVSSMITFGNVIDSITLTTNQRTIPSGRLNIASTYYWKVLAHNQYSSSPWSEAWNFSTIISNISIINKEVPSSYKVFQNYPNPFNPTTNIKFEIPKLSDVKIAIYDITGKEMEVLVNEQLQAGTYQTDWNAANYYSGIYFYKITTGDYSETKRMMVVK